MLKRLILILVILSGSSNTYAANEGDEAPESDIGLASESVPDDAGLQIPEVTFTVVDDAPVIDGEIIESFWKQAMEFSLDIEFYPTRLAPAVVETKAWILVSETHVYVAFRASDPDPEKIRSASRDRDASKEDDYVSIIIDPTGTLAKKYEFRVNPHGTLSDVLQDTISDRYIYDWDTEWDGAASLGEFGYSAELAIPLESIRSSASEEDDGHKGVVVLKRSYPRRVDRTLGTVFSYSPIANQATPAVIAGVMQGSDGVDNSPEIEPLTIAPQDMTQDSIAASGQKSKVESGTAEKKLKKTSKFKITPHYIYHLDEERSIGGEFEQVDEHKVNAVGADIEYQIDSAKKLDFTINPNYADVEADMARQSINNPFVVFEPEKRKFFRSTSEYYNTLIPTVYTRNIVQPELGASFIGDYVHSSFGILGASDSQVEVLAPDSLGSEEIELLESSASIASRYRYSKDRRSFGLVGTLRSADGYHNALGGVDGLWDISVDDKLRYQALYSDTMYPKRFAEDLCEVGDCIDTPAPEFCPLGSCSVNAQVLRTRFDEPLRGYAVKLRYKHDGPESLYWATYDEYSPDFRADLGFQESVDVRTVNLAYGRKWYLNTFETDEGKSRIRAYLTYTHSRSHEDDNQLENGVGLWSEFRGSYQSVFRVGKRYRERAVNRINQNSLDTGSNAPLFDEDYWQWYLETSPWPHWTLNLDGRLGKIADADNLVLGDMKEIKPKLTYRIDNWQFLLQTTFRNFDVDGSKLYSERFFSFTTTYRANQQLSHRLLYLEDLTLKDSSRWLGFARPQEIERTFEYSLIYKPNKKLSILSGIKAEYNFESDINDGDVTNRQVYTKIERKFN